MTQSRGAGLFWDKMENVVIPSVFKALKTCWFCVCNEPSVGKGGYAMATMKQRGSLKGSKGFQDRRRIKEKMPAAMPRDDLREAYAGSENKGPSGSKTRADQRQSTNVKARKTRESKGKTPIR